MWEQQRWSPPPPDPSGNGYQFGLGLTLGQTVTELQTLRSETVTELRGLREDVQDLRHWAEQTVTHLVLSLRPQETAPTEGAMAQVRHMTKLLQIVLPYVLLALIVGGKLTLHDLMPVIKQAIGAM